MNRRFRLIFLILVVAVSCSMISFATEPGASSAEESLPLTLEIHKIDSGTQLPIAGAEFILSNSDGYYLATAPTDSKLLWSDKETDAYPLVTDGDGIILIQGLFPGTYALRETVAPEGYLLLEVPVEIQLMAKCGTDSNGDTVIAEASALVGNGQTVIGTETRPDHLVITVENTYNAVLPDTGGLGTSLFYVFGFAILFAFSLVIATKRLLREA